MLKVNAWGAQLELGTKRIKCVSEYRTSTQDNKKSAQKLCSTYRAKGGGEVTVGNTGRNLVSWGYIIAGREKDDRNMDKQKKQCEPRSSEEKDYD